VIIPVTGGSCIPDNPPQTGLVSQVVDGDSIRVILEDGLTYSVRYIGMDTPENTSQVEYFGPEATAKNTELVWGKVVTLIKDVSETDRFGRLLRYVLVEDVFVNYELVAQGYANVASFPPDVACIPTFQAAERKAAASKLGLWGMPPTLAVVAPTASSSGGAGGNAPCNCGGPDLNCSDFGYQSSAQACYNYCVSQGYGDVFRLDRDNDGRVCESLP
jgi:micrococcal nuclease